MVADGGYAKGRLRARPSGTGGEASVGLRLLKPGGSYLYVTWDLILERGRYGRDIAAIDEALGRTFSPHAVDPGLVAVGGYSDGASYALSLGISNGDLFGHVLAFSPGFMAPAGRVGSPRFFVSHGIRDGWLPIDRTSRRIVSEVEGAGYAVRYREFDGPHVVPSGIALEAVKWFTGP